MPLIVYYVKLFLLGSTPRSVYTIKNTMRGVQWGTLFPSTSLLMVITLAYSVISPLINGLACGIFFLLFQLWKYLFMYQLDMKASSDTGGLFFPKAMTHIFVGLYVEQICLAALFFLSQNDRGHPSAIPEGALMVVLIVVTVCFSLHNVFLDHADAEAFTSRFVRSIKAGFHLVVIDSYGPLLKSVPLSLVDRAYQLKLEESKSPRESNERAPLKGESQVSLQHSPSTSLKHKSLPATTPVSPPDKEYYEMSPVSPNEPDTVSVTESARRRGGEVGPTDFHHPALGPARIVWIPLDTLGLGAAEEREIAAVGVDVSTANAFMSEKGTVDVSSTPPGDGPAEM